MARTARARSKSSLADLVPPPRKKRPESLTSREQEILELIWAGFKNKEIGQRLKISVKTVEAHRANMMKKMRVSNTAQLLKTASNSVTATAADTLSDATFPFIGMLMRPSHAFKTPGRIPSPSPPNTKAIGPVISIPVT